MVSHRQRLARKRFKEEHPELFPKAEQTPPKDPNKKKKKKKSIFKKKKADPNNPKKKNSFKKHPLRVPGMRPGDSCFICKEQDHIAKNCPKKAEWEKNKKCLLCRKRGHSLKNCPNKNDELIEKKFCYNCGETSHTLAKCPQPLQEGGTKFAICFICNGRGHLSKNCPQNKHGIYPEGGCCEICHEKTHLKKDCPKKGNKASDAFTKSSGIGAISEGRVTKFTSGDDLEDDFMIPETNAGSKDNKSKKKQGPKVVNFTG